MRRSLARIPISGATTASKHAAFSTSSSGRGRGRGFRNELPFLANKSDSKDEPSPTEQSQPQPQPPLGHGRGRPLPSFTSLVKPPPPASAGRGRGFSPSKPISNEFSPQPPPPSPPPTADNRNTSHKPGEPNLPSSILSVLSGAGRGKPMKPAEAVLEKPKQQQNRHIRPPIKPAEAVPEKFKQQQNRHFGPPPKVQEASPAPQRQKLSQEEAAQNAKRILSRDDEQGGRGRGGYRGRGGRGREKFGRGGRGGRGRGRDKERDDDYGLVLGDNADGEKLAKRLGPDMMNKLVEAFEEMGDRVLPSVGDDLFLDALDTNLKIECEPEYLMGEFDQNPDIDEKPPIPLRDALEKMKPFLMAYEGIRSQEEWEEVVEEAMETVPLMKEIVDHYSGPDRVTAKQQQEELERVAKTLPESSPSSVKRFTDRAILSLQSNPGWGFDKKCQFMDKLVWEVSQQYK